MLKIIVGRYPTRFIWPSIFLLLESDATLSPGKFLSVVASQVCKIWFRARCNVECYYLLYMYITCMHSAAQDVSYIKWGRYFAAVFTGGVCSARACYSFLTLRFLLRECQYYYVVSRGRLIRAAARDVGWILFSHSSYNSRDDKTASLGMTKKNFSICTYFFCWIETALKIVFLPHDVLWV